MSKAPALVLLRESLGNTSRRFDADHAESLLAYPGTVWIAVTEEAPAADEPQEAAPKAAKPPKQA